MAVDLPSLSSLTIGTGAFSNTHHFDIHQFPNLISLSLGYDIIDKEDSFELNGLDAYSQYIEIVQLRPMRQSHSVSSIVAHSKTFMYPLVVLLIMDNSRCQIVLLSFLLLLTLFGCMFLLL